MSKKLSFHNHSAEELHQLVADARGDLRDLRFSVAGSKNRNVKLASALHKKVARALTELTRQKKAQTKA